MPPHWYAVPMKAGHATGRARSLPRGLDANEERHGGHAVDEQRADNVGDRLGRQRLTLQEELADDAKGVVQAIDAKVRGQRIV